MALVRQAVSQRVNDEGPQKYYITLSKSFIEAVRQAVSETGSQSDSQ